eukprot:scaffold505_cov179-Amphora_coffeaeformis.AAC.3
MSMGPQATTGSVNYPYDSCCMQPSVVNPGYDGNTPLPRLAYHHQFLVGSATVTLHMVLQNHFENATFQHERISCQRNLIHMLISTNQEKILTMKNNYKSNLMALLSYLDGVVYPANEEVLQERLLQLTLDNIVQYFKFKVYGSANPGPNDNPTQGCSSSLYYDKKAISFFIPNKHIPWNDISKTGNPIRSIQVNEMIKAVQKKETRQQCKSSKARRPLKEGEFRTILTRLRGREDSDTIDKYGIPALLAFQFHMIGRIDNCASWQKSFLRPHDVHVDKSAKARLTWSMLLKNDKPLGSTFLDQWTHHIV